MLNIEAGPAPSEENKKRKEVPVITLSDLEVEELEKADPEEVAQEAAASVEKFEKTKELVNKIYGKLGELMPAGSESEIIEAKKKKAMEIIQSGEFQRRIKNALENKSQIFDEDRFIEAHARLVLGEVNKSRQ